LTLRDFEVLSTGGTLGITLGILGYETLQCVLLMALTV
jgi:hypothetical protein